MDTVTENDETTFAYAILGMDEHPARGSMPDDFNVLVANGRQWLEANLNRLQGEICHNSAVRGFIEKNDIYNAVGLLIQLIPDLVPAKAGAIALLGARGMLAVWCDPKRG